MFPPIYIYIYIRHVFNNNISPSPISFLFFLNTVILLSFFFTYSLYFSRLSCFSTTPPHLIPLTFFFSLCYHCSIGMMGEEAGNGRNILLTTFFHERKYIKKFFLREESALREYV
ncbi:hypothetical protein, unlikely [Trypanosoma brucei gambiense DAL972]|uniref:Uncharacterized protein n=1 Tax=Trypanosoma brucei gambiense (strain MHOM/CI/86/DAL972) TaxID=679716 RepID=D0A269_TRYB9|nr:hypothetical protein, unlikely [Trypanosoma brucei gambiense DAL972]CBH15363.1 hypothetical protein, unlikely [Trypanosoma brucei gambiense DAL972]|eukprot:XP_011777627.1 hypothetical protein, unlikely [Trypanosoma brucei gambiense DAL972]